MKATTKTVPETRKSVFARIGDFFFFHRNWMSGMMMITLLVCCDPVFPGGSRQTDVWLNIVGFAVIFLGQGLRALVIGLAYIERGGKEGKVWASKLVTEGCFSHCRNPLYVGNILVYFGLFLLLNNPWAYLIGIPFVLVMYKAIVAAEEAFLRDKFGSEYDEYCKNTPRWSIKLGGLSHTVKGMTFRWTRVILKEYGSTLTWILVSMAIMAREADKAGQLGMQYRQTQVIGAVLIVSILSWATIRHLKISRKLPPDD